MTPVADPERPPGPVVVMLPAEIDIANGAGVGQQLCSAFAPGVTVVIADMTSTVFCDSSGISQLVLAHHCATAHHAQLRLAVPHAGVLDVLKVTGVDRLLVIYPSLDAALAAGPGLGGEPSRQ
jgi:anti-sigma B factor antagonist